MDVEPVSVRLYGGASFPGTIGSLTVTWPLAVAWTDNVGVNVDLRSRILKRVLKGYLQDGAAPVLWAARWEDLSFTEVDERCVVMRVDGRQDCRFIGLRRAPMMQLIREFKARDVSA